MANGLIAEGIKPQARVAHLDKSSDLFFELLFGVAKANAVMVSVNWRLAPPEVLHIVNDAEAEILFVGEEYFPVVEKIRDELTTVRKIVPWAAATADSSRGATAARADPAVVRRIRRPVLYQRHHRPAQGRRAHQRQFAWMFPVPKTWLLAPGVPNLVACRCSTLAGPARRAGSAGDRSFGAR